MDEAAAEEKEEDGRDVSDNPPSGGEAGEVAVVSAMLHMNAGTAPMKCDVVGSVSVEKDENV